MTDKERRRPFLGKPFDRPSCDDCAYCRRHLYHSGKWHCMNPAVKPGRPVPWDLPCFVRRGSKEAARSGL